MKQLSLILLLIFLLSLVACGKPEEPVKSKDVTVDYKQTLINHLNLLKQHEELKVFCEGLQAQEVEYINIINALHAENFGLKAETAIQRAQVEQLADSLNKVQNQLLQVGFKGGEQLERLQEEHEKVLARLGELNSLYPPKDFSSKDKLVEWLANSGNITELGYLGLQRLALADGYIVSVHPWLEYCVVVAGDYWYRITLGDKDLVEKLGSKP